MAVLIEVAGSPTSPLTYTVPGSTAFIPRAASATFDGSGASTAFVPCMKWLAQDGSVIGRYIGPQIAAGGSAEVSWAPFLGGAGLDGISFNTDNEGGWLQINTNLGGATATFDDQTITNAGAVLQTSDGSILALGTRLNADTYIDSSGNLFLNSGAGPATEATVTLDNAGNIAAAGDNVDIDGQTQIFLLSLGSVVLEVAAGANTDTICARVTATNFFAVQDETHTNTWLRAGSLGIFMPHLPTVNPGVSKQLWNNAGVVNIVP